MEIARNFKKLDKNDAPLAGGKGASLGEMTQAGISVPPGFVVLSASFEEFIKDTDLVQEIDAILDKVNQKKIHTVEHASEKIRELILNAEMPKDIADKISRSFKELNTKYVAVRSSATAEDGKDHAWAGQLESYLNTTEDDVLTKVKLCWSSLFTPRAIFYRFEKGLRSTKISVAVVIQKMVESEVSGIAFSVHPVTEDQNQLIIEAGFGLGEAIVSGSVTPDSYVVEKNPRHILDINVSTQNRALYRSKKTSVEHGNNEWRDIPEPEASSQVLTETQILELAEIILNIEKHYGFPCDIEWAFEKGKFYIIQSRPITTLTENKDETNDSVSAIKGVSANKGKVRAVARLILTPADFDNLKKGEVLVTAMTSVDFIAVMERASAFVTNEGGITSHAAIVAREMNKPCIIGTGIATQIIKDGDVVEIDANIGVVKIISPVKENQNFDEWVFMWSTTPIMPTYWTTSQALLARGDVYAHGDIFCYFDGMIITTYMQKSQLEKFKTEGEKYLDPSFFKKYRTQYRKETENWWKWARKIEKTDYTKVIIPDLIKDHSQFIEYARDSIAYFGSTRTEFTYAAEQRLEEIIKNHYKDKWPDIFGILTVATVLDDIQKEYLDWLKMLSKTTSDRKFLDHASKYPWLVFGQFNDGKVMEFLRSREKEEKNTFNKESARLKKAKNDLKTEQNKILNKIGDNANEGKYLAEFLQSQSVERMNIKSYWAGSYYLTRKMWMRIAERTNLPLWDMIGFVTPPEIEKLLDGEYKDNIEATINDRKKSHALVIFKEKLKIVGSKEADSLFIQRIKKAENIDNTIKGQTAMLGFAKGKVRKVIAGDLDMLQNSIKGFKRGEILVTSMTQPNMMVIAERAVAIITDEGGITSHAAIIARELKIPCIVGCLHSMQLLNDGDEIEVDANNAIVRMLKKQKCKIKQPNQN